MVQSRLRAESERMESEAKMLVEKDARGPVNVACFMPIAEKVQRNVLVEQREGSACVTTDAPFATRQRAANVSAKSR